MFVVYSSYRIKIELEEDSLKMEQTVLMTNKKKTSMFSDTYKFIALIAIVGAIIGVGLLVLPHAQVLMSTEGRAVLIENIQDKGIWGMLIFVIIQVVQVVIFIIPGEAVEVIAGMLYGTWGGYLICQIGIVTGTAIIFYMVKALGYGFINQFIDDKKLHKLKFLQNNKKLEKLVFILFFIPGTPKDILTYFIPFTGLPLSKFLLISSVARIPAIISSTFAGAALQRGEVGLSVVTFIVVGIISCIGIGINKKFMEHQNRES